MGLPVLVSLLIAVSAVLSLVTIISIYREGGILKRLRATPLRPQTILTAHVIVKLILTAATLALMVLAGKRYYPVGAHVPLFSFTIALLISTWSILSIGFLIASIVPTARFAQPIGAIILYPMIGVSGLFVSIESLPPVLHAVARMLPLTYAVPLLQGIWNGDAWSATCGRRNGASACLHCLHCALGEDFSLGIVSFLGAPKIIVRQTTKKCTCPGNPTCHELRHVRGQVGSWTVNFRLSITAA